MSSARRWLKMKSVVNLLPEVEQIVRGAASLLQHMQKTPLIATRKEHYDIVTEADLKSEAFLIEHLRRLEPTASVLAEETASKRDDRRPRWIIDPLDGTINYAHGLPWYGVSVAYEDTQGIALGILNAPAAGLTSCYVRGLVANVNGEPAQVTETSSLANAVVSVCLTSHFSKREIKRTTSAIGRLAEVTRGVRVIVSAALETAFVAAGRLDAFVSLKSDIVSHAATLPLIRSAGGKVTTLDGSEASLDNVEKIASNGLIHDELLTCLRPVLATG